MGQNAIERQQNNVKQREQAKAKLLEIRAKVTNDMHITETGMATSALFWTMSHVILSPYATPTHAVWCTLRSAHAYWMLIDAGNPMLCPIHVFRHPHHGRRVEGSEAHSDVRQVRFLDLVAVPGGPAARDEADWRRQERQRDVPSDRAL